MEELWEKEEHKEIKYEPKSVREILTEMKDISELILDLAYSAVIFASEDIASEVRYLEARMDTQKYQIGITAMVAARTVKDAEQLSGILQVASAAERISNAAGDIVNLMTKYGSQPFLREICAFSTDMHHAHDDICDTFFDACIIFGRAVRMNKKEPKELSQNVENMGSLSRVSA